MRIRCYLVLILIISVFSGLYAQKTSLTQDAASEQAAPITQITDSAFSFDQGRGNTPAERYFLWVDNEVTEGRWKEASAALERAADFSNELSDISYLCARVYAHENRNVRIILKALMQALDTGRWFQYTASEARFMAAKCFITLRYYNDAIEMLSRIPYSADASVLRLSALKGLCFDTGKQESFITESPALKRAEFRSLMLETMDRYPRDPRPLRLYFSYLRNRISAEEKAGRELAEKTGGEGMVKSLEDINTVLGPAVLLSEADNYLLELVLRQLPLVLEADPELAWMASPFIHDREEAMRLIAAYRAGSLQKNRAENFNPSHESVIFARQFSLISAAQAVEELFASQIIDRDLIAAAGALMKDDESKALFMQNLLSFTGIITVDDDMDGIPECKVFYNDGYLREYYLDEDQDGETDLYISFISGEPQWARQTLVPGLNRVLIHWEKYPYVMRMEADQSVYIPRPMEFRFAPVSFICLSGTDMFSGLLFPYRDYKYSRLDRRALVFNALQIQRPSKEFEGAVEWIDLDLGIPWRSMEILNSAPVSITEYNEGRPIRQWADLDRDSRMETLRVFRKMEYMNDDPLSYQKIIEFSMSDWNGDGLFETSEEYLPDGTVIYSWDMDGSGMRNYSERRLGDK